MTERHVDVTQEAGAALFRRQIQGAVVMLNLLRFRDVADYSASPALAPAEPISGREAYQNYIDLTLPFLTQTGGEIMFLGDGGRYLIGPQDERWDLVMLIRQNSLQDFLSFSSNENYQIVLGHRTAALEDSRLLPLVEIQSNNIL
ncbi:MAG: DUF1330 domain-containing protein [Candidatus Promineifilaceae bacterium]|jgi:uncharacterized protein (DUF1330 family)